ADLNNDGLLDMVVGTYQGGLLYFEQHAEAVGIAFEAPKSVLVYPNPSDSWLHIDVPFSQQATAILTIYDLNGKTIFQQKLHTHQTNTLSIADLPKGMYLLHLATAEQVYTQKWVR
ncbi:MAG TPA: T9SS type A sorting domain-containing protein, partial [Chitinophagales bacterium]|nr:T9SS type A sorting domain-containing protein [Chitinophagales bacterium]